jgi:hypothetical protein
MPTDKQKRPRLIAWLNSHKKGDKVTVGPTTWVLDRESGRGIPARWISADGDGTTHLTNRLVDLCLEFGVDPPARKTKVRQSRPKLSPLQEAGVALSRRRRRATTRYAALRARHVEIDKMLEELETEIADIDKAFKALGVEVE